MTNALIAENAESKEPELSSAYYTHKRTSLLASGALLVLSIAPNKTAPTLSYEGVSIALGGDVTLFILALTAAYYLMYFCLIWRTEGPAYVRAKTGRFPELQANISAATSAVKEAAVALNRTAMGMRFASESLSMGQFMRALKEHIGTERAEEMLMQASGLWPDAPEGEVLRLAREEFPDTDPDTLSRIDQFTSKQLPALANRRLVSLIAHGKADQRPATRGIEEFLPDHRRFAAELDDRSKGLLQSTAALAPIGKMLTDAKAEIQLRLTYMDLVPCIALFVISAAHYLGRYYTLIHFSVTDIPTFLGLVSR